MLSCELDNRCSFYGIVKNDKYNKYESFDYGSSVNLYTLNKLFGGNSIISNKNQIVWNNCKDIDCFNLYRDIVLTQFNLYSESLNSLAIHMPVDCGNQVLHAIENGFLIDPLKEQKQVKHSK